MSGPEDNLLEGVHRIGGGSNFTPVLGYIANTGLRVSTALQMKPEWIDLGNALVHYPPRTMKAKRKHVVELNDAAKAWLSVALNASPERPFPYTYWQLIRRWHTARVAAGFPTLRIHDLRHSFVSNQLDAGSPIHVVRDMAAHGSLAVTALYAHSTDEARQKAAKRVQVAGPALKPVQSGPTFDTKRKTPGTRPGVSAGKMVGHEGLEPSANGLRIHCSTN